MEEKNGFKGGNEDEERMQLIQGVLAQLYNICNAEIIKGGLY
jgi:hypothetical protein